MDIMLATGARTLAATAIGLLLLPVAGGPLLAAAEDAATGGKQLYVSPDGSDEAAGTSVPAAFKTIAKAAALVGPGDTINVLPGTYVGRARVARSGTAEAPITIRRHGEGKVVVTMTPPDPEGWHDKYALNLRDSSHIVVDGITFKDCAAWIMIWDSDYCTVKNCVFDGARIYNCLRINNGKFNRILDCRFLKAQERTGFREESAWIPVPGADYIEIFRGSNNNLVQGCRFGAITHTAVSISAVEPKQFAPTRNVVRNNIFENPYWKCIWVHAGAHNLVEGNVCTGTAANFVQLESGTTIIRRNLFIHYKDSTGAQPDITLRGAVRMQYDWAQHNRIYNNLFFGNERTLTNNSYRWHVVDNVFKNNIFYANGQTIFLGFPDYREKNANYFIGNLMMGTAPGQKLITLERDTYTLSEAQEKLPVLYRDNIEANPLFVGEKANDFRLAPRSPCIDRGVELTRAAADGSGTQLAVEDALYFSDGFGLTAADEIVVGDSPRIRIAAVDYEKGVLILDKELSWKKGDAVNLPFRGAGPDIGPHEFGAGRVEE